MTNFLKLHTLPPVPFGASYPLFTRISLETTKTCTRDCWFCPSKQRGPTVVTMAASLYNKILEELAALKFDGVVQWFYLNEPLLDREWPERLRALRTACPGCTIHLTTNWDIYAKRPAEEQVATIHRLFDVGVNSLNLNDYDNRGYAAIVKEAAGVLHVPVVDHCWKRLGPKKRVISCGPLPEKLHSWTGFVQDYRGQKSQGATGHCPRPMRHIVVQYDGRVPLCCAVDPTKPGATMFGDVATQTLQQIWNSRGLFEYRAQLQNGIRIGDCAGCDASVAYPKAVRRVTLEQVKKTPLR